MPRKGSPCTHCARQVTTSFLCSDCCRLLHELLIGSNDPKGQPGIVRWIIRLRETAYLKPFAERNTSTRPRTSWNSSANLPDQRAADLVGKISTTLERWACDLEGLITPRATDDDRPGVITFPDGMSDQDASWAWYLANHTDELSRNREDTHVLLGDLLAYAKEAARIIDRRDVFLGLCDGTVRNMAAGMLETCSARLYASEGDTDVECRRCRKVRAVAALRAELIRVFVDKPCTKAELVELPKSLGLQHAVTRQTVNRYIKNGRLQPSGYTPGGKKLYTYRALVAAREMGASMQV